ncbi:VOC family protein [Phormidium nigroviride]
MTQGNRGDRLLPLSAILAELCQDNGIVEVVLGLGDRLFLGIDHSAIAISNTEQSLKFYRDLLGMQFDGGSFNQGETQARLDCLSEEVEVKITAHIPQM